MSVARLSFSQACVLALDISVDVKAVAKAEFRISRLDLLIAAQSHVIFLLLVVDVSLFKEHSRHNLRIAVGLAHRFLIIV